MTETTTTDNIIPDQEPTTPNQRVIEGMRHVSAIESPVIDLGSIVRLLNHLVSCPDSLEPETLAPLRDVIERAKDSIETHRMAAFTVLHPAMGLRPMPRPRDCDGVPV